MHLCVAPRLGLGISPTRTRIGKFGASVVDIVGEAEKTAQHAASGLTEIDFECVVAVFVSLNGNKSVAVFVC